MDVLGGDFEEPETDYNQTIRQGSRGPLVAEVQEKLNIAPADGIFGPGTARIVKEWQKSTIDFYNLIDTGEETER